LLEGLFALLQSGNRAGEPGAAHPISKAARMAARVGYGEALDANVKSNLKKILSRKMHGTITVSD
jgi:hypothetical protein